MLLQFKCLF